jgi:hypothetical protein
MIEIKNERISIKGKIVEVNSNIIDGKTIVVTGKFIKIASVKDEICDDGVKNPEVIINELKKNKIADIFTFEQKLPDVKPKYNYFYKLDNLAVLKIQDYNYWWEKQINNDARRMVRKAEKNGVIVKAEIFNDELINGIKSINDETPLRQGKPFWHYKKDFETVKTDNSTYLDRTEFICAYYNNELIGFDKIFYTGNRADQIQLLAKLKHRDKSPTNAIIAKAIDVCAQKGISYLTYGKYLYGNKGEDSLSDFKKRNGFEIIEFPRYYAPLTLKGTIAIKLNLYKKLNELLPSFLIDFLINIRTKLFTIKYSKELKSLQ